jgi:hypothetical protein
MSLARDQMCVFVVCEVLDMRSEKCWQQEINMAQITAQKEEISDRLVYTFPVVILPTSSHKDRS